METLLSTTVIATGLAWWAFFFALTLIVLLGFIALCVRWLFVLFGTPKARVDRLGENPIIDPVPSHWWESQAVFNPGAFEHNGVVHLFYRAIGEDGISRIGYAYSADGIHFTRHSEPVFDPDPQSLQRAKAGRGALSYETLSYNSKHYTSGGGWGGCEDPRAVLIDDEVYLTFTSFEGWDNVRMKLSSMALANLEHQLFSWDKQEYLSAPGEVQKNWVLFPEKVQGKFAVLHNIDPIEIAYLTEEELTHHAYIKSHFTRTHHKEQWDTWVRGAGTPPLKTSHGWLLLYHAISENEPHKYKVGAMLLDLKNPTNILFRSTAPILEPSLWYENDWKPGVVYASGAVILRGQLFVYYGAGDKHIAAAHAPLHTFLHDLTTNQQPIVRPISEVMRY